MYSSMHKFHKAQKADLWPPQNVQILAADVMKKRAGNKPADEPKLWSSQQ